MMETALHTYLILSALVGVRLGVYIVLKLDRFDWAYNKHGIWVVFAVATIFWPLLFLRPRILLDPSPVLSPQDSRAAQERERDQLRKSPPPCGEIIRYRQDCSEFGEETFGEFLLPAVAVERQLETLLRENPHLEKNDEGAILGWVRGRNARLADPTDIPTRWSRFEHVADDLIRAGEGWVFCRQCGQTYPTGELIPKDDKGRPGWNFNRLRCRHGHDLLIVETAHIYVGNRSSSK